MIVFNLINKPSFYQKLSRKYNASKYYWSSFSGLELLYVIKHNYDQLFVNYSNPRTGIWCDDCNIGTKHCNADRHQFDLSGPSPSGPDARHYCCGHHEQHHATAQ